MKFDSYSGGCWAAPRHSVSTDLWDLQARPRRKEGLVLRSVRGCVLSPPVGLAAPGVVGVLLSPGVRGLDLRSLNLEIVGGRSGG